MRVSRRLVPLLACAVIAGTPAVAQAQGGAGDDQYQDPFGGSGGGGASGGGSNGSSGSNAGSSGSTSSGSAAQGSGSSAPEVTQEPGAGSSSSASSPAPATSSATSSGAVTRSELPRTGLDVPAVALIGVGLVAAGVGLRLRVAHGRRS